MSNKAMTWAWEIKGLSAPEKLVLMAIADNADDGGVCFSGHKYIGAKVEMARETVCRITKRLEEKGILIIEHRKRENGGDTTNLYHLRINGGSDGKSQGDVTEDHGGGDHTITGGRDATITPNNPPNEPKYINTLTSAHARARGSRLSEDWNLPDDWRIWAENERPDLDIDKTAEIFKDHWLGKPGKEGRKADWLATWRNWVRREKRQVAKRYPHEADQRPYHSAQSANEAAIRAGRERRQREEAESGVVIEGKWNRVRG